MLSFFWYNFFHQSYKSHSRESGLYWASSGCILLLIQNFPPKLQISFKRVWSLSSIWWVLSFADTKCPTKVTNFIQESLVFIEHLVSDFFCWYKVSSNQGTKLIEALFLCLLSLSLWSFLCFLYWAFWRALLLSISLKFDGDCLSDSLSLFFDFSSKFLIFFNVLIISLLFWGADLFYCYTCGS